MTEPPPPSAWFTRHADIVVAASALGPVVDLACGRGRHSLACGALGLPTVSIDRDAALLRGLDLRPAQAEIQRDHPASWRVRADLEAACGIPLREGSCGAILIFRFLYRPMFPAVAKALEPGGLLLYETFTVAQRKLGNGPRNPAFLLEPGELRRAFPGLEILAYEEGLQVEADPGSAAPAATARLAARKPTV